MQYFNLFDLKNFLYLFTVPVTKMDISDLRLHRHQRWYTQTIWTYFLLSWQPDYGKSTWKFKVCVWIRIVQWDISDLCHQKTQIIY